MTQSTIFAGQDQRAKIRGWYDTFRAKLAIDVINGGPSLRVWVDDASATPGDLDALALPDEAGWREEISDLLIY